jgi:hypothetical protein
MPFSKTYISGDRLMDCDICGFTYRFSQMRKGVSKSQKGFVVGPICFDPVHPAEIKPKIKLRKKSKLPEVR